MKVKELIEELKKLDQDRGIWVVYDSGYAVFSPVPDGTVQDKYDVEAYQNKAPELESGDYIIIAG